MVASRCRLWVVRHHGCASRHANQATSKNKLLFRTALVGQGQTGNQSWESRHVGHDCRVIRTWQCGGRRTLPACGVNWLARVDDCRSHLHGKGQVAVLVGQSSVRLNQMQTSPVAGCRLPREEPNPRYEAVRQLWGMLARLSRLLSL